MNNKELVKLLDTELDKRVKVLVKGADKEDLLELVKKACSQANEQINNGYSSAGYYDATKLLKFEVDAKVVDYNDNIVESLKEGDDVEFFIDIDVVIGTQGHYVIHRDTVDDTLAITVEYNSREAVDSRKLSQQEVENLAKELGISYRDIYNEILNENWDWDLETLGSDLKCSAILDLNLSEIDVDFVDSLQYECGFEIENTQESFYYDSYEPKRSASLNYITKDASDLIIDKDFVSSKKENMEVELMFRLSYNATIRKIDE